MKSGFFLLCSVGPGQQAEVPVRAWLVNVSACVEARLWNNRPKRAMQELKESWDVFQEVCRQRLVREGNDPKLFYIAWRQVQAIRRAVGTLSLWIELFKNGHYPMKRLQHQVREARNN